MHKQEINDLLVFHRTYHLLKRIYRLNAIQKSGTSIDVELQTTLYYTICCIIYTVNKSNLEAVRTCVCNVTRIICLHVST